MRGTLRLLPAALLLDLVLIQPNHPGALTWGALRLFPLELPVILLGLIALPERWSRWLRRLIVAVLLVLAVLKLADFAMFTAFNRGFNPAVDWHLIEAGWRLGSGTVGILPAAATGLGALGVVALLGAALAWALRVCARVTPGPILRGTAGAGALVAALVAGAEIGQAMGQWRLPVAPPGAAFTARVGLERLAMLSDARSDRRAFRRIAAADPFAEAPDLFDRLGGRDVQVIFVESYGHASLANPLYAPTHTATLRAAEAPLQAVGLAMRSGWLASPITGGQSWLAHGTLASGLRIASQPRYGALLSSPRRTLYDLARDAGYRTVAVMPAITLPWPEGAKLGFDIRLAAADLGYAGQPFNWITMPDQYVYAAWQGLVPHDRPLFTQIATVSSHAPWVPVPEMVPWPEVGDGRVFDRWATSGDAPAVVWADPDRVRAQYGKAIDYALQAVTSYALQQAAAAPLMIVLGDHQPADFVAQDPSPAVPVHLIGPPEVLALFDGWDWSEGLLPDPATPVLPMEDFRDRFLRTVSSHVSPGPPA